MEIVEDSGFDSDHKTSASVPMAEESEQNKIYEVCYMIIYYFLVVMLSVCVILTTLVGIKRMRIRAGSGY